MDPKQEKEPKKEEIKDVKVNVEFLVLHRCCICGDVIRGKMHQACVGLDPNVLSPCCETCYRIEHSTLE